jgi:hypothetical protein
MLPAPPRPYMMYGSDLGLVDEGMMCDVCVFCRYRQFLVLGTAWWYRARASVRRQVTSSGLIDLQLCDVCGVGTLWTRNLVFVVDVKRQRAELPQTALHGVRSHIFLPQIRNPHVGGHSDIVTPGLSPACSLRIIPQPSIISTPSHWSQSQCSRRKDLERLS